MRTGIEPQPSRAGYALIVVLATLLVLILLFTTTTRLSLRNIQNQSGEQVIALRDAQRADLLAVAISYLQTAPDGAPAMQIEQNGELIDLSFQDVGGLIDLNAAAPEFLDLVFATLELGPEARSVYVNWRQSGRRITRHADFIRITGADYADLVRLAEISTVFSGRHGVSSDDAPSAVRKLLAAGAPVPETPPSGVNFRVYRSQDGISTPIGVISVPPPPTQGRVLSF